MLELSRKLVGLGRQGITSFRGRGGVAGIVHKHNAQINAEIQRLNAQDSTLQFGRGMRRAEGDGVPAPRGGVRAAAAAAGVVHPSGPRVQSARPDFYNLLNGGEAGKPAAGRGSRGGRGGRGGAGPMNIGIRRPTMLSNQLHNELLKDTAMDGEVRVTYKPLADKKQVGCTESLTSYIFVISTACCSLYRCLSRLGLHLQTGPQLRALPSPTVFPS